MNNFAFFDVVDEFICVENKNFHDVVVIACQHLLGTQLEMFFRLEEKGLKKENLYIIGKAYSTNQVVFDTLLENKFNVRPGSYNFEKCDSYDSTFQGEIGNLLDSIESSNPLDTKSIIIVDDGGALITEIYKRGRDKKYRICGFIEQTSSGYHKVAALESGFVNRHFRNIARSKEKLLYESPHIAWHFVERMMKKVTQYDIAHPMPLIVGLGPIGHSIKLILQHMFSIPVVGYDIKNTTRSKNYSDEISFIEYLGEEVKKFNIIIEATGRTILSIEQLSQLGDTVMLMSVGSSDRGFSGHAIRMASEIEGSIHSDWVHKNVCLCNSGFPLTFYGNYNEVEPEIMQYTVGMIYASILCATKKEYREPYLPITLLDRMKQELAMSLKLLHQKNVAYQNFMCMYEDLIIKQ